MSGEAKTWAEQHGFRLSINDEGRHWTLQKNGFLAEWWPISGKLVFNGDLNHSWQAADWGAVIPYLERETDRKAA